MKYICSTFALLLSGCATDCYHSGVCRAVIGALPPQIEAARNDEPLCDLNARVAEDKLQSMGVETKRMLVEFRPANPGGFKSPGAKAMLRHTFVAARVDGRWYAVDNGALPFCDGACRLDEALHGVRRVE